MLAPVDLTFSGEIVQWRGPAPYFFVPLPEPASREVHEWSFVSYGWGVIPVTVRLGDSTWETSLFPKDGGYLLPLRLAVRKAQGLEDGDTVAVRLTISPDA